MRQKMKNLEARRKELETTVAEMVDVIEKYLLAAPFAIVEGEMRADFLQYVFPERERKFGWFEPWYENWMCRLFGTSDEPGDIGYSTNRLSFILGFLAGCKTMGATREQLLEKGQGFIIPILGQARYSAKLLDAQREERAKAINDAAAAIAVAVKRSRKPKQKGVSHA